MERPHNGHMNHELKSPSTTTTTTATGLGGRLASLRDVVRARRANPSPLAREIAAYPAMRSAAPVLLSR